MQGILTGLGIVVVIGLVLVLVAGVVFLGNYNYVVSLDESVKSQWAQVDNQLLRRYELIPNLVETVKGVAGQEKAVFLGIAEARKAYFAAQNPADKAVAAGTMESALSRLLMFKEEYPALKSNEAFMKLQDSIEGTENRLAVERGKYNTQVRVLNEYRRGFPGSFFAGMAGIGPGTYFEVQAEQKVNPKVSFQ